MDQKVLVGLAVLPAALLIFYVYKKDKVEKEPIKFLAKLFGLGALTVISAVILELLAEKAVLTFLNEDTIVYAAVNAFLCVALVEEGGKYFVLKKGTWHSPEFNYTFDAVVYAVVVSMGFATVENILYVVGNGTMGIAIMRGILSVPGHAIDGVFMGLYYGRAKQLECMGDEPGSRSARWKALLMATVIHGFYDFCLMSGENSLLIAFFAFEVVITVVAIRKVNKLSREDTPLFGAYSGGFGEPIGGGYGAGYDPTSGYGTGYGSTGGYGTGYGSTGSYGAGFDPTSRYGAGFDPSARYGAGSGSTGSSYGSTGGSSSGFDPFGRSSSNSSTGSGFDPFGEGKGPRGPYSRF